MFEEILYMSLSLSLSQADLQAQIASLEHALHGKDAEIEGLMQALKLKDNSIKKLEQQLQRMATELARAEERARQAEAEKAQLKVSRAPVFQLKHTFAINA